MIIVNSHHDNAIWEKANIAEQSRYMNVNNSDEDIGQIVISKQLAESLVDQLLF